MPIRRRADPVLLAALVALTLLVGCSREHGDAQAPGARLAREACLAAGSARGVPTNAPDIGTVLTGVRKLAAAYREAAGLADRASDADARWDGLARSLARVAHGAEAYRDEVEQMDLPTWRRQRQQLSDRILVPLTDDFRTASEACARAGQ